MSRSTTRTNRFRTALAVASVLALASCDGGGGGGGGGSGGGLNSLFLQVIGTSPPAGTTAQPINQQLTLTFSSDVDPATLVPGATLVLQNASQGVTTDVAFTLAYDPATFTATLTVTSVTENPALPNQPVLNYATPYRVVATNAIRSTTGRFLQAFTLLFQTEPFNIAATASDPVDATMEALIENRIVVTTPTTGQFQYGSITFNVDIDPMTVSQSSVLLREKTTMTPVALAVAYDAATKRAVFAITQTGQNPLLPAVAALNFDTDYELVATQSLRSLNGGFTPASDLVIEFRTAKLRAPAPGTGIMGQSADLMYNEVLIDPTVDVDAGVPLGDADGDGTRDAFVDEFVELLNLTGDYLDLRGLEIAENPSSGTNIRHRFPATAGALDELSILPPRRALVIFGGILNGSTTPNGSATPMPLSNTQLIKLNIGASKARRPASQVGSLGYANAGDVIVLRSTTTTTQVFCFYDYGPTAAPTFQSGPVVTKQSAQKVTDGDPTALFEPFTGNASPGVTVKPRQSPGNKRTGQQFP